MKKANNSLYLFTIFFVMFETVTYLSNDMIMPGMINIVKSFNANIEFVAISLFVFILGNTSLQLFIGPMCDNFGKRKILILGNILFSIFSIFIATTNNIYSFLIGRFLEGSGIAFVVIGYTIVHEAFDDKRAVRLTAILSNITILAPLLGPILGVIIIEFFIWRAVFIFITIAALVSLVGLIKYTPLDKKTNPKVFSLRKTLKLYFKILLNKDLFITISSICLGISPIIAWIGISPVFLIQPNSSSYKNYLLCQIIAISGISTANILIQFLSGRVSFFKIIKTSSFLILFGSCFGLIFSKYIYLFSLGISILGLGIGLYNGIAWRSIMTNKLFSANMINSLTVFCMTISMAVILEISNILCAKANYSVTTFAIIIIIISIIVFILVNKVAEINKYRKWQ